MMSPPAAVCGITPSQCHKNRTSPSGGRRRHQATSAANRALNRATRTWLRAGAASGARIRYKMSAITPPGSQRHRLSAGATAVGYLFSCDADGISM
ncbi:hypothetical protein MTO96_029950 [Rhipicephalus appendiculatus]